MEEHDDDGILFSFRKNEVKPDGEVLMNDDDGRPEVAAGLETNKYFRKTDSEQ